MKICGACERELPEDAYSGEQRGLRQSIRRCVECVAAGNELVLMKKEHEVGGGRLPDLPAASAP